MLVVSCQVIDVPAQYFEGVVLPCSWWIYVVNQLGLNQCDSGSDDERDDGKKVNFMNMQKLQLTSFLHEGKQVIEELFSLRIRRHVVQLKTHAIHCISTHCQTKRS